MAPAAPSNRRSGAHPPPPLPACSVFLRLQRRQRLHPALCQHLLSAMRLQRGAHRPPLRPQALGGCPSRCAAAAAAGAGASRPSYSLPVSPTRLLCAPTAGSLIVSAADATQRHLAVLLAVYCIAFLGRSLMACFAAFGVQLAIALLTEAAASPQGALIDAAVMASATDVSTGAGGAGAARAAHWEQPA